MDWRVSSDFKVKQVSLAFKIPLTQRVVRSSIQFYRDPNAWVAGIGSQCEDGRHVQFFDYDGKSLKQVLGDIQFIQEYFELSHAYIFELDRKDSYHVIIPCKLSFRETYSILRESNSDWGHQESAKKVRGHEWVLRTGSKGERKKPRFIGYLKSRYDRLEISSPHKQFIELHYDGVPYLDYKKVDNFMEIPKIDYNTGSRTDFNIPKSFKRVELNETSE